jgi:branched-chain amino acid transport system permease protein
MEERFFWIYRWFRSEVLAIPGRVIACLFVLGLFLVPLLTNQPHILRILALASVFAIYAASWDLLAGFTGQVNLGQTLFFGVSAYASALTNIQFGLPPWISIVFGAIVAVLAGLIVGIPAIRLRGFYLSLVTLAFPVILTGLIFVFPNLTGGELGLSGISRLCKSRTLEYYGVLIVMLISLFAMYKFVDVNSKWLRIGIILRAIREDEITARASGVYTTRYKLLAFAVSGFFAGVAGGLYAHLLRTAGPSTLDLFFSFQAILWTVFGGMGTIHGAVAGVYILYPLVEVVRLHPIGEAVRFILFSLLLIFTLLFMPEGLTTWIRDKIEVNCPRCKIINLVFRRNCRVCRAPLHLKI